MLAAQIALFCKKKLELEHAKLGQEYYYASLPLCVIDAIFSINVKYEAVRNVVSRCTTYLKVAMYRDIKSNFLPTSEQLSVNDFLTFYEKNSLDHITRNIYRNRCRTSSKNGILKSEAVYMFLNILKNHGVNYFQDMDKIDFDRFEKEVKSIPGQKSGISLKYFFMLAGNEALIKPDRMIRRFVEEHTGQALSNFELMQLFNEVIGILKSDFPHLTLRELDHEIWKYQR